MINEAILNYQKKEEELIDIEKSLAQSEERKRTAKSRAFLVDVDKNIKDMDQRAEKLNANFEKLNAKIKALSNEIEEYSAILEKSTTEEEVNYFIKKVSKLDDDMSNAIDEINKTAGDMKQLLEGFEDYKKKIKLAKDEYETNKKKYDELKNSKSEDVKRINGELKEIEKKIPKSDVKVFEEYKKVREKKIFPAIVPLVNEHCGGCRMELSMKRKSMLASEGVIECEECGRIIYSK